MALPALPSYMQRIRAHLLAERGMSDAKATKTAIATATMFCKSGASPNLPVHVNAASRAEACTAVAELQAMTGRKPKPSQEPAQQPQEAPAAPSTPKPKKAAVAISEAAWDGSASRFTDEQYARSCVLDRGPQIASVKERYSLPIREPDGTLNRRGVHAAAQRIGEVRSARGPIQAAARRLLAAYAQLGETPPETVKKLAKGAAVAAVVGAVVHEATKKPKPAKSEARAGEPSEGFESGKAHAGASSISEQKERNMDFEERTIDVDVEDLEQRGRTVHGYAATYGTLSHDLGGFRETIAPGAFADVLASSPDVRALLNHDPNQVLGRTKSGTLRLFDEQRGLRFELDLPDSPLGENVREAVRRRDLDGASFRFKVRPDGVTWEGETRTLTRIAQLVDCSLATFSAYPDTSIELRSRPDNNSTKEEVHVESEQEIEEVEERTAGGGSLRVEDRAEHDNDRSLHGAFKRAGWEPGVRAEVPWPEFLSSTEQRALTWTGDVADLSILRREGVPFGADRRYAWPAFPSVSVDSGLTSVQVLTQTARTLPSAADVIRAIDAVTAKPEAGSTVAVVPLALKQVAAVQKGIPNVYLETEQIRSVIGQDLRLALNEGLDKMVLDATVASGFQAPSTNPLLVSIRKAITTIQASGYNPDLLILTPANAEALDVLQTVGSEKFFVFGPGRFAPGSLFGLNVRVSKSAAAPIVVDSQALGRMYASPVSLMTFEENFGGSNSSLIRLEGHAAFGVERQDAAVRIAAS